MSESTEELHLAVQGLTETLAEVGSLAEQLQGHATELAEEAAGHGWHGIATRMQEAAGVLEVAAGQVGTGRQACEAAADALGLINDKIPAEEVGRVLTVWQAIRARFETRAAAKKTRGDKK